MACLIGVFGLLVVLLVGCNKKSLDASASGKAYFPPPKPAAMNVAATPPSDESGTGLTEQTLSGGKADRDIGGVPDSGTGGGGAPADLPPPTQPTEDRGLAGGAEPPPSFPPLTPSGKEGGDDRTTGEIVIAKAEPSEAVRRQTEQMQQEQLATALAGLSDVFFAYDSWKLTEEAMRALEGDAGWLKANQTKSLTIEGYCDERGTGAYNLVLGERRAKAVRNYLIELGVDTNRLAVVSYGKERPFCKSHDEACYKLNRRAHLVLQVQ
jgi:peptidoglycan-associated lipoprotein